MDHNDKIIVEINNVMYDYCEASGRYCVSGWPLEPHFMTHWNNWAHFGIMRLDGCLISRKTNIIKDGAAWSRSLIVCVCVLFLFVLFVVFLLLLYLLQAKVWFSNLSTEGEIHSNRFVVGILKETKNGSGWVLWRRRMNWIMYLFVGFCVSFGQII